MSETVHLAVSKGPARISASRLLVLASMFLLPVIYTCFTLYGSLDFLLNAPNVIRLTATSKAVIDVEGVGAFGEPLSLPDDWRNDTGSSKARRYVFVFELPHALQSDQEVYLPQVADNAQITINGKLQPYYGSLQGSVDLHWSRPLVFAVPASVFLEGRNELLVDVYANERALGSLQSVSIGPRGVFESHLTAVMVSKRGLAYVLLGFDIFAIIALVLYATAVSGRFYMVSVGICIAMVGGILPHVVGTPLYSVSFMFCGAIACFLMLQSFCVYLCTFLFPVDQRVVKFILIVNGINIVIHLLLPSMVDDYDQLVRVLIYPNLLTQITGLLATALLVRRFAYYGETAVGLMLLFAFFVTTLGIRDFLVIWGWLPSYQGFYTLHSLVVMVFCLAGLIVLRIRAGYREQARYQASMREALAITRESVKQADHVIEEQSLGALVSRIATTYSHEFRNPLAAALATNKLLLIAPWGSNAQVALRRIQRSIHRISDALDQQFDFQRAMQRSDALLTDTHFPTWLVFVKKYKSCKVVWLSDPTKIPENSHGRVEAWLKPYLEEFEKIPSVCMIHQQKSEVVLHLYLHLNVGDELHGRSIGEGLLNLLQPESIRDAGDGQYLYWRYEF